LYEFKCDKCNGITEKIVKSFDDKTYDESPCLICGDGTIHRIQSVPSIKFVGKDFYITEERARRERARIAKDYDTAKKRIAEQEAKKQDKKEQEK
jgi:predicted nucleic acid-binding Zn ribbon protein